MSETNSKATTRVLFVDDEPLILSGIRRMLRSQRNEWEMHFSTSGEEALTMMEEQPFDVMVTDMRMPGISGVELLQRVAETYPSTVRIVLSGHSDLEAAARSVFVSHQFLAKPCEAETIRDVVTRALSLQRLLEDERLKTIPGGLTDLPVMPGVYKSLIAALTDVNVDIEDVAQIIEQDGGMSAKLLKIVNSSYFGLAREIIDLQQAVTHIGLLTLRDMVLSVGMFRQFEGQDDSLPLDFASERRRASLAANIARRLIGKKNKEQAQRAFLATMLSDIGALVLATNLPKEFQKVHDAGGGTTRPRSEVEQEIIGTSHAEIGAYLLGLWGVSYPVVEAVAFQNRPSFVPTQEFGVLGATHVANVLAAELSGHAADSIVLDEAFLEMHSCLDKLDAWRDMAREIADEASVSA